MAADKQIGYWLVLCCLALLVLILVGGATRLTGSGLSMVDWRPVTGFIPPLTEQDWQAEKSKYRESPEYQQINRGMSLDDFKAIYWYEYGHRVIARLLGLIFIIPLIVFWWRGTLPARLRRPMIGLLLLGALQGYMGWFMVRSGLVDVPRVSPYRLAMHLSLALLILMLMWRMALGLLWPARHTRPPVPNARRLTMPLLALVVITIISGAFVAGLDAGMIYNSFPLMGKHLLPPEAFALVPGWVNFFENPSLVQFVHRVLAISTVVFVLSAWAFSWRRISDTTSRRLFHALACAAVIQLLLGIATLLLRAPTPLAVVHQGWAVVVLSLVIAADYGATRHARPSEPAPA